jgi:hypothetical protein
MPNWKKVVTSGSSPEFNNVTLDGTLNIPGFSNVSSSLASLETSNDTKVTRADLAFTSSNFNTSPQGYSYQVSTDPNLNYWLVSGSRSAILNTSRVYPNVISGSHGAAGVEVIVNGLSNCINQQGAITSNGTPYSSVVIVNGDCNVISGSGCSTIIGGTNNKLTHTRSSIIGGGNSNCIEGIFSGNVIHLIGHSIVGGQHNRISGSSNANNTNWWSIIGGGEYNKLYQTGCSIIGAGHCNRVLGNSATFVNGNKEYRENSIVGGRCNDIIDERNSHIVGGACNKIIGDSTQNTTLQGSGNIIGAGHCNVITGSCCSAILGGKNNCLKHDNSFIIGSCITSNAACTTFVNNLCISGSLNGSTITGVTASFGKYIGIPSSDPFPYTASSGPAIISQSFTAGNVDSTALRLLGSGSVSQSGIFEVEGSAGPLFSVQDGLDGILMEVNNISGLPLFQVSSSNEVFVNRGNLTSGVTTATASFAYFTGSFVGDGSGLTGVVSSSYALTASHAVSASYAPAGATPTLQEVTTQGNTTNQGLIVSGSTIFKPLTTSPASIEFSTEPYSGQRSPTITLKNASDQKTVHIGHSINDGLFELYNSTETRVVSIQEHFQAFSPPGGISAGYGTYFGVTSSISPTVASPDSYVKIAHDGYSAVPYSILQLNKKGTFAGSGSITLQGIMNSNGNSAPSVGITSVNGNRVVNFGGPGFVNANNVHNNYLKYGLQVGGDFTGNSSNMALTDGSLIMSGSTGGFSVKSVSSEAEIKTNDGDTTLTLGTTSSFTAISASSYISASEFIGDGTNLNLASNTTIPAASAGSTAGRVVFTTTNGELTSETGFTYDATTDRLTVPNLTTTTFTASFITSSTIETSGSNIFGDEAGVDIQTLIGTTKMTGSAEVTGSLSLTGVTNALNFTNTNSTASVSTKLSFRHASGTDYNNFVHFGSNYFRLNNSAYNNAAALYVNGRIQGNNFYASSNSDGFNILSYNSRFTNNYLALYGSSGVTFGASNAGFATIRDGAAGTPSATYDIDALLGIVSAGNSTGFGFKVHNSDDHETFAVQDNKKVIVSGSLEVSGSVRVKGQVTGSLTVESSGSTVFEVIGSEGTLFSIDDDLDGTIFTANDRSGLPVLEASASGEVYIGKAPQSLYTTAVISSTTAATTQSIYGLSTSSYGGAFFDYTVQSGSDARAGSIMSVWNGSNISFTETTTTDIGDTTDFNVIVHISESQAQIASHATRAGYNIKTIIRSI